MKRIGKSLLCYWSAKKVCDSTNDEDLDNGEMNHEDLTDANKDSLQSKDTDSDTNDSELESEGETEFQFTSEQSSSRQFYKQKYHVMIVIMPCYIVQLNIHV